VGKILDRKDLAELGIRFHRDHLRRLIKQGRFPRPFKVSPGESGKDFWTLEQIETFLAERQAAAADAA
jgi:predicted DNA-binding transcriptional regulator AlpA